MPWIERTTSQISALLRVRQQLCRYLLRPPIAQERLALRPDGTVLVTLKTPWRDGTTHLCFEPMTLLERLAALTPRPRINVLLYHGILAPRATWRAAAVIYGRVDTAATHHDRARSAATAAAAATTSAGGAGAAERGVAAGPAATPSTPDRGPGREAPQPTDPQPAATPTRRWGWAELLQRVFGVDVLACPRCGGRMRVIAMIDDPQVVRRILTHLGLTGDEGPPADPWPCRAA